MNIIANQPIRSYNSTNLNLNKNIRPAFTGIKQAPKKGQIKQGVNIARKIYDLFFVPRGEKLTEIQNGHVLTTKSVPKESSRIAKKYKLWSKEPEMTVIDNFKTNIRKKLTHNADGTNHIEYRDMHQPEYKISIGFENVKSESSYEGGLSIKYLDKEIKLSEEQRAKLHSELAEEANQKYSTKDIFAISKQGYEKFTEYMNDFYKDPINIARNLVSSPHNVENQLRTIPSSMPYGIEEILSRVK